MYNSLVAGSSSPLVEVDFGAVSVDAVVGDGDTAAPEYVDTIAVLAVASIIGGDTLDAIADDERSILAAIRGPDLNRVVADIVEMVAGDLEAFGIEREQSGLAKIAKAAVDDAARAFQQCHPTRLAANECAR